MFLYFCMSTPVCNHENFVVEPINHYKHCWNIYLVSDHEIFGKNYNFGSKSLEFAPVHYGTQEFFPIVNIRYQAGGHYGLD